MRALGIVVTLLLTLGTATAQARGPSTPEERAMAVKLARLLETDPLNPKAKEARQWFTIWLVDVPDITVSLCSDLLGGDAPRSAKTYSAEILVQMAYSGAAFIVEHPDNAQDETAVYRAGLEGALKAYESIQKQQAKYVWPFLDELRQQRDRGTLQEYVEAGARKCQANRR
jgi:hypothetical protein